MKHAALFDPSSCYLHYIAFDSLKSHTPFPCPASQLIYILLNFQCVLCILNFSIVRIRTRIVYWWQVRTTILHQDQDRCDQSLALTRGVNLATPSSVTSAEEIRESGSAFQSLMVWGKSCTYKYIIAYLLLINISSSSGNLICHRMIIPAAPDQGDKVTCWYTGITLQTFVQQYESTVSPPFLEGSPF